MKKNYKIVNESEYNKLVNDLYKIGMTPRMITTYLNKVYKEGKHNSGETIDKYADKFPSKELIEWRIEGGNIRTFVGRKSEITSSIETMYNAFGW